MKKRIAMMLLAMSLIALTGCEVEVNGVPIEIEDSSIDKVKEAGSAVVDKVSDVVTDEDVHNAVKDLGSSIADSIKE